MSEPFVFDPRCILCKDPFGAVSCGTMVSFHCRPLAKEGFTHCALILHHEFSGHTQSIELAPTEAAADRMHFSAAVLAPRSRSSSGITSLSGGTTAPAAFLTRPATAATSPPLPGR